MPDCIIIFFFSRVTTTSIWNLGIHSSPELFFIKSSVGLVLVGKLHIQMYLTHEPHAMRHNTAVHMDTWDHTIDR